MDSSATVQVDMPPSHPPPSTRTAEEESWGDWSWRQMYNGLGGMCIAMHEVVQIAWKHERMSEKTREYSKSLYIPTPLSSKEAMEQFPGQA